MFGKIFVRECRNAWRVPAVMAVVAVVLSVIVRFIIRYLWGEVGNYRFTAPWAVRAVLFTFIAFYVIFMIVANMMVLLYMPVRFYREIYSDQGYLYHSLPVSKGQLLGAHALASGLLILAYYVIDVLCMWIVLDDLGDVLDFLSIYIRLITRELSLLLRTYGQEATTFTVIMIIVVLVSPFANVLQVYCAVSLGQMVKKHRVAAAFAWYFVLGLATSIVTSVVNSLIMDGESYNLYDYAAMQSAIATTMITTAAISLVLVLLQILVFYVITYRRMQYHLDLE